MQENAHTISQRHSYEPGTFTKFLWWLATAEQEIIRDCKVDRNRYAITGLTVLCTWLFATLAWTYFFSTVVHSFIEALPLGIFMGFIILCIDRALIKGISSKNKSKAGPLLLRGVLALTIGTFMAQPALLYLFDKEIHQQISLDNIGRKKQKQQQLDSLYASPKNELIQQKEAVQKQLDTKYTEVAAGKNAFITETDGTGGSGKVGLRDIAQAKQNEYLKSDAEYKLMKDEAEPKLKAIDSGLATIETEKLKSMQEFDKLLNDGFLVRIQAMNNLVNENTAVQMRYYLLLIIILLIELMPVIAKSILPNGTYDERIRLIEMMEKEMAESNAHKEQSLKELYNKLAFEQDGQFIKDFFDEAALPRKSKMEQELSKWSDYNNRSFDDVWESVKKEMLTRQEF